ncbi:hypothetical protein BT63DRAFT_34350 [Microthyrium microscopicum]|uniref:Uncharacterized protein n=1 Tax=Microthyrium microscopicum TaxID=703497 RepID=A0A6A6UV71_9PEZI|nr:hypothetical protein BT63DRAFT_34350 [Microthyrium microscopicum]
MDFFRPQALYREPNNSSIQSGRLSYVSLGDRFDLDPQTVRKLLESQDWVVHSSDESDLLTLNEQARVIESLQGKAGSAFVSATDFSASENINLRTLETILARHKGDRLSNDINSSDFGAKPLGLFYFTTTLRQNLESDLTAQLRDAQQNNRKITIAKDKFRGLSPETCLLILQPVVEKESIHGTFSIQRNDLHFVPDSYTEQMRSQLLERVASGDDSYLELSKSPGQNQATSNGSTISSGQDDPRISIVSGYAVSNKFLDSKVAFIRSSSSEGAVAIPPVLAELPEALRPDVLDLLKVRLTQQEGDQVSVLEDYAVNCQWTARIEVEAIKLASDLADQTWEQDTQLKPKTSALKTRLRDLVVAKLISDPKLVDTIWKQTPPSLSSAMQEAFATRLESLETDCDEQFVALWTSRVVDKSRIYVQGLDSLKDEALKTQLEDVLRSHIATELLPGVIARAKKKHLIRSTQLKLSSRLPKLHAAKEESDSLRGLLDVLETFNRKIGIPDFTETELQEKKKAQIQDMVRVIQKDQDPPRLFLSTIIVLQASSHEGVLYALGKSAPKLLKQLKPSITEETAARLELLKDAVKAGKVTTKMKDEMREIAATAAEHITSSGSLI